MERRDHERPPDQDLYLAGPPNCSEDKSNLTQQSLECSPGTNTSDRQQHMAPVLHSGQLQDLRNAQGASIHQQEKCFVQSAGLTSNPHNLSNDPSRYLPQNTVNHHSGVRRDKSSIHQQEDFSYLSAVGREQLFELSNTQGCQMQLAQDNPSNPALTSYPMQNASHFSVLQQEQLQPLSESPGLKKIQGLANISRHDLHNQQNILDSPCLERDQRQFHQSQSNLNNSALFSNQLHNVSPSPVKQQEHLVDSSGLERDQQQDPSNDPALQKQLLQEASANIQSLQIHDTLIRSNSSAFHSYQIPNSTHIQQDLSNRTVLQGVQLQECTHNPFLPKDQPQDCSNNQGLQVHHSQSDLNDSALLNYNVSYSVSPSPVKNQEKQRNLLDSPGLERSQGQDIPNTSVLQIQQQQEHSISPSSWLNQGLSNISLQETLQQQILFGPSDLERDPQQMHQSQRNLNDSALLNYSVSHSVSPSSVKQQEYLLDYPVSERDQRQFHQSQSNLNNSALFSNQMHSISPSPVKQQEHLVDSSGLERDQQQGLSNYPALQKPLLQEVTDAQSQNMHQLYQPYTQAVQRHQDENFSDMSCQQRNHLINHSAQPGVQRPQYLLNPLGQQRVLEQNQGLCPQHHRGLEFYCRTDNILLCSRCLLHGHIGHEIQDLDQEIGQGSNRMQPTLPIKEVPPPGLLQFSSVQADSLTLTWSPPQGHGAYRYRVSWRGGQEQHSAVVVGFGLEVTKLQPGEKYHFAVATLSEDGRHSICVEDSAYTDIPAPERLSLDLQGTYAVLKWMKPPQLNQVLFQLDIVLRGQQQRTIRTDQMEYTLSDLQYGADYTIFLSTLLKNGRQSKPIHKRFTAAQEYGVLEMSSVRYDTSPGPIMANLPGRDPTHTFSGTQSEGTGPRPYSTTTGNLTQAAEFQHGGGAYPTSITKEIPVPECLTVSSITASSARISWEVSPEMEQIPHGFLVSYQIKGTELKSISTESCSADITGLKPGAKYTVRVYTKLQQGGRSQPASAKMKTEIPVPECLTVSSITASSARISWEVSPEMEETPHSFLVSYQSKGTELKSISTESCSADITGLKPGAEYIVEVYTKLQHRGQSQPASAKMKTEIPVPECLTVSSITASSARISWEVSPEMKETPHSFLVSYQSKGTELKSISTESCSADITGLKPGAEYIVEVYTKLQHRGQSQPASAKMKTEVSEAVTPTPLCLTVSSITASSAHLSWKVSREMEQTPHSFLVSYQNKGTDSQSISTESCSADITDLKPGTKYTVRVYTVSSGRESQPAFEEIETECVLPGLLTSLGLDHLHGGKLTLSSVLEINRNTVTDEPPQSLKELPWTFLRKLMMSNLNSRNIKCVQDQSKYNYSFSDAKDESDAINPVDLITALFHCSDPFLQQEMVSKMAMCQFAVPLLLPNCDTQQCTLMLWAMRDIVKKYRPHSLSGGSTFIEGRIVDMDLPTVSFVRLGESSLPKSQILNKLISNPHQHNDTFVHHDMECGDVPRRVSDGLVEVSWYLPSGNSNIDVFTQPVAIANLRGDSRLFKTQMSFLLQTSAAVFIFSDDLEGDLSTLANRENKAELFLVTSSQRKNFSMETLRDTCRRHRVKETNVIIKKKQNDSEFVKALRFCVNGVTQKNPHKITLENMGKVTRQGILVDEHCDECIKGKQNAEGITASIQDVVEFKSEQLPLHGEIWKQISQIEKETFRMRKADKDIESYKSSLITERKQLREKQHQKAESEAMAQFIAGISQSGTQRLFFLKWLKIMLDTLSRSNLSTLREKYKECCKNSPQNKKEISRLDEQISNCSLGPEHFFRELGQLYECACSLPENNPARQQVRKLPALCAQMLLDGFPVELVDGDASNIPIKWISQVLTQLHRLVDTKSRILVMTVLGVQSTGKSTLLNTMFGVQFAVSSGRCTRGAFMLLMKVSEEFRSELNCDFIMVIDTEGLKSPELAALDTSYEHDNELATLVIGLSDITIINVAMENNTEMKDILQIVVHAFLRMKEVGKKPRCLFVHQNVSDMSAHDSNMRDRKKLMEQLDEMTRAAAKMEKKVTYTKFTDVMEYDPDKDSYYIPGLWHGTPPMAPVNTGYSENVYELKRSLIGSVQTSDEVKRNNAKDFLKWTVVLWDAVKYEKFIFSFRNSLVADAYTNLCTEYNKWEWSFQKEMNSWQLTKETVLSNFGKTGSDDHSASAREYLKQIIAEASGKLDEEERGIHQSIEEYFKSKDSSVALVERYKVDFKNSANCLRQETESSLKSSLMKAVEIKEGLEQVNAIKNTQTEKIEKKVQDLVQSCRDKRKDLSDTDLKKEFETMWKKLVAELAAVKLLKQDVFKEALHELKQHSGTKPGSFNMKLNASDFKAAGEKEFMVESSWISLNIGQKIMDALFFQRAKKKLQEQCNKIIKNCDVFVSDKVKSSKNFNTTYIREVLYMIDEQIKQKDLALHEEGECELKFHICWKAAIKFQEMHEMFIRINDPKTCLEQSKEKFLGEFKDLFHDRDQCLKKAEEFTKDCLTPAVKDYITKRLGQDIADEMMTGDVGLDFSTRTHFQFAILKQLLEEDTFEQFQEYTHNYKTFVNEWILVRIIETFSQNDKWQRLKLKHLSEVVQKIKDAITQVKEETEENTDMKMVIQKIRAHLKDKLTFQEDDFIIILKKADTQQFADNLIYFLLEMKDALTKEYNSPTSQDDLQEAIRQLPFKPHELLFNRLCGCGHQCPFCGTPCEAGGGGHTQHFSSMHRPKGLGSCRFEHSQKLVTDICTTAVTTDTTFKSTKTNGKYHPYKQYKEIYPDWEIDGDASVEASDYWKYVMMTYNKEFADSDYALPADIPETWKELTKAHAKIGLNKSFNIVEYKTDAD
ncbi:interferon-induced very large GTPase 1-like [Sardina pilchardus]|uniref:interferon-induced very large GTPase 1-like n=1 Tax=Sardina pilchardus TaxID=27697 RepID=UPI002E10B4C7